ncbi:MAG TPA: ABC transporter ATP-binding protein [Rhizobiaceae bacterium]|nr:ABC transporter ATP-binding protein [Rhizobiaceae bacterium]
MKLHRHFWTIWNELWARRRTFGLALFCVAASAGLYVLMPIWAGELVGGIFAKGDVGALAMHLLLGLAIFFGASLFGFGRTYLMVLLSHQITAETRARIFHHILRVSPRTLASVSGGELVSSFSNDLQTFHEALVRVIAVLAPAVILVLVFGVAMAYHSWLLFLCSIVLISPLILVTSYFGNRLHGASHGTQEQLAGLVGSFEEMLGGAKEIKSFNREEDVSSRFNALNARTLTAQLLRDRMDSLHPAAVSLAAAVGIAAMVLLAAYLLQNAYISIETLTAFLVCVGLAFTPLQEASHSLGRLIQLVAVMDRFERLMAMPPEKDGTQPLLPGQTRGAVTFDHVNFSYVPGANFGLRDFNLDIAAGQRVALVGPSGGGKSTILDFVPRFLTPDTGTLRIDGEDAADLRLADLRRQIGVVFQQPVLFEGTLLDNLRFGAPDASLDEVMAAARAAHVDEFAQRLTGKYDARIEARGGNLSVGQRQRIAIARVFLKDPRILLLDEPTSALDTDSERLVRDALARASAGRTTLIVAHRLNTVRSADRIVVIENGRIVEDGTHQELFARGGLYHRLCREQLASDQDEWNLQQA